MQGFDQKMYATCYNYIKYVSPPFEKAATD